MGGGGGVDLADMVTELYRINFKLRKWYIRIAYWCLVLGVVNVWLLYLRHKKQNNEIPKLTLLQYQSYK